MKRPTENLSAQEWIFDEVPADELIACCYWEYARESAFIRGVRRRCLDPAWKEMTNSQLWEYSGRDLERIQSIGYASEVILHGFFCPPDGVLDDALPLRPGEVRRLTGAFPKPWQALTRPERDYRKHIGTDVERIPLVPFQRGLTMYAKDIVDWVAARHKAADAEEDRVRAENPNLSEDVLWRRGKLHARDIRPSLRSGNKETTVVEIGWGNFTNEEIVTCFRKWVKANRPDEFPAPSRRGHKPNDWRANLTRLAVMRLMSCHTALDIVDPRRNQCPEVWRTKQFSRRKWADTTKWHDARREAGKLFRSLFPFLDKDEQPLSWKRQRSPGK